MPFAPAVLPQYNLTMPAMGMLNQSARTFGAGVAQAVEQYKQLNALGKAADTIYKNEPGFGAVVDPEVWKGMGSRDKVATLKAYTEKLAMDEFKERARLRDQQLKESEHRMEMDRTAQAEGLADRVAGERVGGALNSYFAQGRPPLANREVNQRSMAEFIAQTPGAARDPQVMRLMQYAPEAPKAAFSPVPQDIPGMKGYKFVPTGPGGGGNIYDLNPPPQAQPRVTATYAPNQYGDYEMRYSGPPELVQKYQTGGGQQQDSPPPPPPKPDVGGYKRGRQYGTHIYLGGDPNDQSNWERVR